MAGKKGKRPRKSSGPTKSPTQSQLAKKTRYQKHQESEISDSDSEGFDTEESKEFEGSNAEAVSTFKMAVSGNVHKSELVKALIDALKDPSVVETLISAIRDDVKRGFEKELDERDRKIAELENKIDDLEMYGRRNGIRIHGIPENQGESTDKLVMQLAQDIGADIPSSALGRSHRVGRKSDTGPRAIIAKFVGHNNKVAYLKMKQELKNLKDVNEEFYVNDVYVNEDLTAKRAAMAKRARQFKKAKRISDTWTRDGMIFIKAKDGKIDTFTREEKLAEYEENLPPPPEPEEDAD